jgi:hypothetical protein
MTSHCDTRDKWFLLTIMSKDANPVFPPELEREILEILAILHPESMPVLLLIARRVKIWCRAPNLHNYNADI